MHFEQHIEITSHQQGHTKKYCYKFHTPYIIQENMENQNFPTTLIPHKVFALCFGLETQPSKFNTSDQPTSARVSTGKQGNSLEAIWYAYRFIIEQQPYSVVIVPMKSCRQHGKRKGVILNIDWKTWTCTNPILPN